MIFLGDLLTLIIIIERGVIMVVKWTLIVLVCSINNNKVSIPPLEISNYIFPKSEPENMPLSGTPAFSHNTTINLYLYSLQKQAPK